MPLLLLTLPVGYSSSGTGAGRGGYCGGGSGCGSVGRSGGSVVALELGCGLTAEDLAAVDLTRMRLFKHLEPNFCGGSRY